MNILDLTHVPRDAVTARSLNVVLFGETGSGKSAVVNLLAGKVVAPTSSDIDGCTKTNRGYSLVLNGVSYTIWDTIGLEQPMMGDTGYLYGIEQMCELIKDLSKTSGVDLLLFCHRRGRITTTTQKNYTLLYEVVCRKSVPIAVVITHLEQEKRMEDWWDQNVVIFQQRGIEVFGHACVTTLSADPRTQESREAIERLLGRHGSNGRYRMPTERSAGLEEKEKDLVKVLGERCGLREHHACRVAQFLRSDIDIYCLAASRIELMQSVEFLSCLASLIPARLQLSEMPTIMQISRNNTFSTFYRQKLQGPGVGS